MLLSKNIVVEWNNNNKKHYESFGYIFSKKGATFIVPIEHLPQQSNVKIEVKCDYCEKQFLRNYRDHILIENKDTIKADACGDCRYLKARHVNKLKRENKMLSDYDVADFLSENQLNQLNPAYNYQLNLVDDKKQEGKQPNGFYKDINKILPKIQTYIDEYGNFPTMREIVHCINIPSRQVQNNGGINNIKRLLGYDKDNLIDDNKFNNGSSYEYIVAQFLIHNTNITYLREQFPFPKDEGRYRSDFTLCLDNGDNIHVEVWGNFNEQYHETKHEKIRLYEKYTIPFISIDSYLFYLKMDTIQDRLYDLFSPYLTVKCRRIDPSLLKSTSLLSDEELLEMIMTYAEDESVLPSSQYLKRIGQQKLFNEASKRYGSYRDFAKKLGKNTIRKNHGYWDEEKIFTEFMYMSQNGIPIGNSQMRELKNGSLETATVMFGGLLKLKLKFFDRYIQELSNIHPYEVKFLNNVVKKRGTNIMNKVTPEQQELAKQILSHINQSA